jgi:hypothetical protein
MTKLLIIVLTASAALAGCAGTKWDTTAGGTPLTVAGINQVLAQTSQTTAQMNQDAQALLAQSQAYKAPEVGTIKQPNGTSIVYCRALTGELFACRQFR